MKYVLGLILGTLLAGLAVAGDEPTAIVRSTSDNLFELIDAHRAAYQADPAPLRQEVRKQLLTNIDTVYSARLVLGQYGRGLPSEKVNAFADALSDLLVRRYAEGLLKFKNRDQVEILPAQAGNTDSMTRVRTKVHLDSGSDAAVDYVFHKRDDRWWVFDVIIEGISYVATFRNQIGEEIRRDGFDSVLSRMQSGELQLEVKPDDKPA